MSHQSTQSNYPRILVSRTDITRESADVIVNAANSRLIHAGGVAGAIARAAGPRLEEESIEWVKKNGLVPTGGVAVTTAGRMSAKYVIHTVGPICSYGIPPTHQQCSELRQSIQNSLQKAVELRAQSICLPGISTNIFMFPKSEASEIIVSECRRFCESNPNSCLREIRLVDIDHELVEYFRRDLKTNLLPQHSTNPEPGRNQGVHISVPNTDLQRSHESKKKQNNFNIFVKEAGVQDATSQVMVLPSTPNLSFDRNMSRQFADVAGPSFRDECQKWHSHHGKLHPDKIAVVSSGDLNFRYVFIAAEPDQPYDLRQLVRRILMKALEMNIHSISIPRIGIRFPKEEFAHIVTAECFSFMKKNQNSSLKLIQLIDIDQKMIQILTDDLRQLEDSEETHSLPPWFQLGMNPEDVSQSAVGQIRTPEKRERPNVQSLIYDATFTTLDPTDVQNYCAAGILPCRLSRSGKEIEFLTPLEFRKEVECLNILGGKRDEFEHFMNCAVREFCEETADVVQRDQVLKLLEWNPARVRRLWVGSGKYILYVVRDHGLLDDVPRKYNSLRTKPPTAEPTSVNWLPWNQLTEPNQRQTYRKGPFFATVLKDPVFRNSVQELFPTLFPRSTDLNREQQPLPDLSRLQINVSASPQIPHSNLSTSFINHHQQTLYSSYSQPVSNTYNPRPEMQSFQTK